MSMSQCRQADRGRRSRRVTRGRQGWRRCPLWWRSVL